MGTLDEHWCNVCKRSLDKKKDKYVEFELINQLFTEKIKSKLSLKPKKPKGIICENCINKDPSLKKAIELMVKAGNPLFKPFISCESFRECENYEVSKNTKVNCANVTVIGDTIYCKRSHVGSLKLPRELSEVRRAEALTMKKMMEKYIKDPKVKELLNQVLLQKDFIEPIYTPPSSILEDNSEKKEKT